MKRLSYLLALGLFASCQSTEVLPASSATDSTAASYKKLTVEAIFSGNSLGGNLPRGVKWSPDGKLVCFLKGSKANDDVLDLWAYDLATGKSNLLVASTDLIPEKDQTISKEEEARRERARITSKGIVDYHWSPTGKYLLFPLGSDLFLYERSSRKAEQLTKTEDGETDPKFSPDEKYISFIRNNEIYTLDLTSHEETRWTNDATEQVWNGVAEFIAQEEMDRMTGYWWSPASDKIAFTQVDHKNVPILHMPNYLSNRVDVETQFYPKVGDPNVLVKLAVLDLKTKQSTWIDLGQESDIYLARVDWLPDGRRLSYQIENRHQNRLDLFIADFAAGNSKLIHREEEPEWVDLHDDLKFFADGKRFTWSSERTGWKHLSFGNLDTNLDAGTILRPITSGEWMMKKLLGIDEKAGIVYFIGSEKSPLENHLYQIGLDGRGLKRITQEEGWHNIVLAPDFQSYLDTYSSSLKPPSQSIHRINGTRIGAIEDNVVAELDSYNLPAPEFLQFTSEEGLRFNAKMIKPRDFNPQKKYPVLIFVYGGPGSQLVRKSWEGNRELWHHMLAQNGILVFTVDGRGTGMRGKNWSRSVFKNLGDLEVRDQVAGAKYLGSLPYIDANRIGIWGWSYGGYMACMSMFTANAFKAGAAVAPVTTWRNYDTHYTERYMGLPKENDEGYNKSAPLTHAFKLHGKFFLVHGMADDNVHFQDSVQLIEALQKSRRPFDLMVYPSKTHTIAGKDAQTHLYTKLTEFFLKEL